MANKDLPEVGAKLTVDGEKEFKSALSEISRGLSVAASEAKLTSAQYADNKDSVKSLTAQSEDYAKKIDLQKDKVETLTKALDNAKEVYGENSKQVDNWQIQLNKANAELIKTESAAKKNSEALKKAEKDGKGFAALKGKYEEFQKAVSKVKDEHSMTVKVIDKAKSAAASFAKTGLKAIGGAATGAVAGVGAVTATATAAGKALYDAAFNAAQAGDAIDEASQRMGMGAEKYQELTYAAKMSGVETATLETAAKKLQSTGSKLDLSQAIDQVASIKDESQRTAKAVELFGSKAAYSMGPMLGQGTEAIKELKDQAQSFGLVMSDEAVAASASFNDALDNMTGKMDAVKNNISAQFLPGITEVMDGVTALFTGEDGAEQKIIDGVESITEMAGTTTTIVTGIIEQLAGSVAETAPEIIDLLLTGIGDNLPKLADSALSIVGTLASSLLTEDNLSKLTGTAAELVTDLVGFLGDNVDLLINAAFDLITGFADGLLEDGNLGKLTTAAVDLVGNLAVGLIDNIPELIGAAGEICLALWQAIKDYDWWGLAKKVFGKLKDSIKRMVTGDDDDDSDGSHAGGLNYVPYDGYIAELHKGERILTAAQAAVTPRGDNAADIRRLERKLDRLAVTVNEAPVNVTFNGSSAAVGRALDVQVTRENRRKTAFKEERNA